MTKELEPLVSISRIQLITGCTFVQGEELQRVIERNASERYKRTCKSDYCRETDEWQCLSCGGTLQNCAMFDPDVDGFVGSPKFCPNCGAEVADGD